MSKVEEIFSGVKNPVLEPIKSSFGTTFTYKSSDATTISVCNKITQIQQTMQPSNITFAKRGVRNCEWEG